MEHLLYARLWDTAELTSHTAWWLRASNRGPREGSMLALVLAVWAGFSEKAKTFMLKY